MMGSLRNPAGWNNLYSLRPTAMIMDDDDDDDTTMVAAQSSSSRNPLPYPISMVGPMARTVTDLALLWETMAGTNKFVAPQWAHDDHPHDDGDDENDDTKRTASSNDKTFRILWLGDWNGAIPVENGILKLCHDALQTVYGSQGHVIATPDHELFSLPQLWDSWTTIRSAVVADTEIATHGQAKVLAPGSAVRAELQWEIRRGAALRDAEIQNAGAIAEAWSQTIDAVLLDDEYDAIALPSAQCWPFPASWKYPQEIAGRTMDTYHRWMEIVVPVSLAGLPCVTIPAGFGSASTTTNTHDDELLPMGIQLAGRRGRDAELLKLAEIYHQSTDWPSQRPPPDIKNDSHVIQHEY